MPDPFDMDANGFEAPDGDVRSASGSVSDGDDPLADARRMAERVVHEVLAANPEATLEDLNAALAARVDAYNRRPQRELGGLSPVQVQRLLADRLDGRGPIRLTSTLHVADLAAARTLANARAFLALLAEGGGFRATSAGNLNRTVVAELLARLNWPADYMELLLRYSKRVNEQDVPPLHVLRILLTLAGLLRRVKGSFRITRKGRELADAERAGELYTLLFRTHFAELNLALLDRNPEAPGFQHTLPFTLYRFGRLAATWKSAEELAAEAPLPSLREEVPIRHFGYGPDSFEYDPLPDVLEWRFLDPLNGFGLAERREEPGEHPRRPRRLYRRTDLFDRFLHFEL
ncbi:MAG: hypothetical protein HY704_15885 [Gemmatimonadetes bacterium]|nr:hypothetical protein [Gemmatimonadota bacterium]